MWLGLADDNRWIPFVLLAQLLETNDGAEYDVVALVKTLQVRHSDDRPRSPADEDDDEPLAALEAGGRGGGGDLADRAGVYLGLLVRPTSLAAC